MNMFHYYFTGTVVNLCHSFQSRRACYKWQSSLLEEFTEGTEQLRCATMTKFDTLGWKPLSVPLLHTTAFLADLEFTRVLLCTTVYHF